MTNDLIPSTSEGDVAGMLRLAKLVSDREKEAHRRRMDILYFAGAAGTTLLCIAGAFWMGMQGNNAGLTAFLAAPVATTTIQHFLGRGGRSKSA